MDGGERKGLSQEKQADFSGTAGYSLRIHLKKEKRRMALYVPRTKAASEFSF